MAAAAITEAPLAGRRALVTGAAGGLGRAAALELGGLGADVAAIDLYAAGLQSLAAALETRGRRCHVRAGDCRSAEAMADFAAEAEARLGGIDILVNNVGQSAREKAGPFLESEEETWRFVLEVSLVTALRTTRLLAPGMQARGWGRILCISSDAALVGDVGLADYAAAKAGLLCFTRSLARELAPSRVTANAICFGTVRTAAHARLDPAVLERVKAGVPMGYIAEPEEAVPIVGFLAGPGGAYITGQTIAVNGGRWFL